VVADLTEKVAGLERNRWPISPKSALKQVTSLNIGEFALRYLPVDHLYIAVVTYQMRMIAVNTNTIFTTAMEVNIITGCRLILMMGR